jgi:hypothetical protein
LGKQIAAVDAMNAAAGDIAMLGEKSGGQGRSSGTGKRNGCTLSRRGVQDAGTPADRHGKYPWYRVYFFVGHCRPDGADQTPRPRRPTRTRPMTSPRPWKAPPGSG